MKTYYTTVCVSVLSLVAFTLLSFISSAQLSATFGTTVNNICNGSGCNYQGPSILINEMMMSPSTNDGSMWGSSCSGQCGEWIEIYNPNLCEPVDVSCYYLGNNAVDGGTYPGGYVIPAGTIIPPAGFLLLRGQNAPAINPSLLVQNGGNTIEIVVLPPNVCIGSGSRLWFPNSGGWFVFYDSNGVPQDAVSWGSSTTMGNNPCIPNVATCSFAGPLQNYNQVPANRKTVVYGTIPGSWGQSIRRVPDGGAWVTNQGTTSFTPGNCNAACIPPSASTCDGTATINVTGGTAPYTYAWDDTEVQTTQTATGLCAGTYTCQVTDALGATASFQVQIVDFVPTVNVTLQTDVCIDGAVVTAVGSPQASGSATGVFTGTGMTGANFNPATAGVGQFPITYTYTDANECQNSATTTINVHALPVVSITANPVYCIDATANIQLSPTGGNLSGNGVTGNQFNPATAGIGSHTLTYDYTDGNGCDNSTSVTVQVVQAATPTVTIIPDICIDAAATNIQVSPTGGQIQVNGTNSTSSFLPQTYGSGTHTISYSYSDANSCIGTNSTTIDVHDLPTIQFNLNPLYCYNSSFIAVSPQPAGGTFTGDNVVSGGLNLTNVAPGNYNVHYEYTDQFGCYAEQNGSYSVTTPITPSFTYGVNCLQQLSGTAIPANPNYTYHWDFGTIEANGVQINQTFAVEGPYPLTLSITDQHGCVYDTISVVDIPKGVSPADFVVPNVITPNGDGINDYLAMPMLLDECFTYKIMIVNRWGNIVFEMDNQASIFDGRNKNGDLLTDGVYFYYVISDDFDCEDEQYKGFCTGNISIVR
jgi:gliding motility-associated-like protein